MIFIITMLTFIALAIAKLMGVLAAPWAMVFSVIFLIPLLYVALAVLAISSMDLVEDPRKDYHNDS